MVLADTDSGRAALGYEQQLTRLGPDEGEVLAVQFGDGGDGESFANGGDTSPRVN